MAVSALFALRNSDFIPPRKLFHGGVGRPGGAQTPLLPWRTRRNVKHDWRGTRCPITPICKTGIVVTSTTFTLFKANTKETRKEVAANGRHLCILALNRMNVIAVTTKLVLQVGVIGHRVPRQSVTKYRVSLHQSLARHV